MNIVVIHRQSKAFTELREAFTDPDTYKVSLDIRDDGIAVKVNEHMWTIALGTVAP